MTIMYLKSTIHGNKELISAWASCETVTQNMHPNTTPTYDEYFGYMLGYSKKLEASVTDHTTACKANIAESDYMQPYLSSNEYYDDATNVSTYMVHQGGDVDMIQEVLQCNRAMKQEKPLPPPRTRQSSSKPPLKELQNKEPA